MQTRLRQVIYVSEKTDKSSDGLTDIFDTSQKNNKDLSITGCLLIGGNSFLQLLEGPNVAVENLYSKIKLDDRHKKVKKLYDQEIDEKLFSSWSMKFAPFNNLEWGNEEFDAGNFLNIKSTVALNVFHSIKESIMNKD